MGLHKKVLGEESSRSGKLQADLSPGGSRWRRLLKEEEAAGSECFKRRRRFFENYAPGEDFVRRRLQ